MNGAQDAATAWWRMPRRDTGDERPFTDFGQLGHGQLDTRVWWQDVHWIDIAGRPHLLADTSPEYRANVTTFLRRGAPGWWQHEVIYSAFEAALLLLTAPDKPPTRQALDQLEVLIDIDPVTWMDTSPLMRHLHDLHAADQQDA